MLEVVTVPAMPQGEPVLARLRREYLDALLQENESLCAACALERALTAKAYGLEEPSLAVPVEMPSIQFNHRLALEEHKTSSSLVKFFTS